MVPMSRTEGSLVECLRHYLLLYAAMPLADSVLLGALLAEQALLRDLSYVAELYREPYQAAIRGLTTPAVLTEEDAKVILNGLPGARPPGVNEATDLAAAFADQARPTVLGDVQVSDACVFFA